MQKYKTTRADRRKNIHTYEHWVYALYQDNSLVYVGVTGDPISRLESHSKSKRFQEFRLIKGFSSRDRAEQFENICIEKFKPDLNIARLKPREAGFRKIVPNLTKDDLKAFETSTPQVFDFELLNSKTIARRIAWQSRL